MIRSGLFEKIKHFSVQQAIPPNPRTMEIIRGVDSYIYVLVDDVIVLKSQFTFTTTHCKLLNTAGTILTFFEPDLFDEIGVADYTVAIATKIDLDDGLLYKDEGLLIETVSGNLHINSTQIMTSVNSEFLLIHIDKGTDIDYFVKSSGSVAEGTVAADNSTGITFGAQTVGSYVRSDIAYSVECLQFIYLNHSPRTATMTGHTMSEGVLSYNGNNYQQTTIVFMDEAAALFGINELRNNTTGKQIIENRKDYAFCEVFTFPSLHYREGDVHTIHDDVRTLSGQVFYVDTPYGARNRLSGISTLFFQVI